MGRSHEIKHKGGELTVFLICMVLMTSLTGMASKKEISGGPDFAYPQTVEENATKTLETALQQGDGKKALESAIQLTIAGSQISEGAPEKATELFDSLSRVLKAPYNSLATLLEAQVYVDVYQNEQWKYDSRKLALDTSWPSRIHEWSGAMFAARIDSLSNAAIMGEASGENIKLKDLGSLIEKMEPATQKADMTVADFIDSKAIDLLTTVASHREPLRFGIGSGYMSEPEKCAATRSSILDTAIARNAKIGNMAVEEFFSKKKYSVLASRKSRRDWIDECYRRFGDTEYGAWSVLEYAEQTFDKPGDNNSRREQYRLLSDYAAKYPAAAGIGSVIGKIENMKRPSVTVSQSRQLLVGQPWKTTLQVSGIYEGYLLLYKLNAAFSDQDSKPLDEMRREGRLTGAYRFKAEGRVPDIDTLEVDMPALEPGRYAIYVSADKTPAGVITGKEKERASLFRVSDLSYFTVENPTNGKSIDLYVTDARTQRPVARAKVVRREISYRGTSSVKSYITDAAGKATLPAGQAKLEITKGNDHISGSYYAWYGSEMESTSLQGDVLTDLGIYHPGDMVRFTGAVYQKEGNRLQAAAGRKIKAILRDANYQSVDTVDVESDINGRIAGELTLPKSGLLGSWRVEIIDGKSRISGRSFDVAEYKQPTFFVESTGADGEYAPGDTVRITGRAQTYSGMPVAGAQVAFTVKYSPWRFWYWGESGDAEYGSTTTTDGDGRFVIVLPTANLVGTQYEKGIFTLNVAVTDGAGETREAPAMRFSLGKGYNLTADVPGQICGDAGELAQTPVDVYVTDMTGKRIDKAVYFSIDKGEMSLYSRDSLLKAMEQLPSGRHELYFSLEAKAEGQPQSTKALYETNNESVRKEVVIWRSDDKRPPEATPVWTPRTEIEVAEGVKEVELTAGSGYADSHVFMLVSDSKGVKESRWLEISDANMEVKVTAPGANERVYVTFVGMHDLNRKSETVTLIPEAQTKKVEIKAESFREKIEPGARERWTFRFSSGGEKMANRPVMAVMSNKALNALAPFSWSFNPYQTLSWPNRGQLSFRTVREFMDGFTRYSDWKYPQGREIQMPGFQFYGYPLYGGWAFENQMVYEMAAPTASDSGQIMVRGSRSMKMAASRVVTEKAEEESADGMAAAAPINGDLEEGVVSQSESMEYRPMECPLAFFMPDLMTDSEGLATIDFDVPQFNGTWQFQITSYDPQMRGGVKIVDAVAAKQVMAQMNAPRFLRTGDKATIGATLYNNSGSAIAISGRIDILDALTGATLQEKSFAAEEVKENGSRLVQIEYAVPTDLSAVTIRVYAEGSGHRDGEQTVVPVLPSSTPVLESDPFYAGPGSSLIKVKMPKQSQDATMSLQYCGNAIWECVTALPEIVTPNSNNILAQIDALYGTAIAQGLIKSYPRVKEALQVFAAPENAGDSTLVSNLEKNGSVKITELNNTPWVRDAASETARMQGLSRYLETEEAEASIAAIMKTLGERQNNDGGWSWCDGMPTSSYITCRVLLHFSMLKGMGYLPEGAEAMAKKAFGYVDREMVKDWEKYKSYSVSTMLNYLYVKSFFPGVKDAGNFGRLRSKALGDIEKGWKDYDIYDKATASILLWREKKATASKSILESLRQYASVSAEKGMWFDNLSGVWSGWNPLITTAQVLEAYSEISPEDPAIDQLRQWLLMSKQTQNWGENRATAEIVQAILSSGSDWTADSAPAEVKVGGKKIEMPRSSKIVDSFLITLTPEQTRKGEITIEKQSAGPAWGGIVTQYVAPIDVVKADRIPQLSIEKSVMVIGSDGTVKNAEAGAHVGDRVRITLTITNDRDMDYVSVTDSRSAAMEPVDQTSGYSLSDGMWYYKEVRDDSTNLFIPFLGKGTHVISYECFLDRAGEYTAGIATAQSQYAPVLAAHSAGIVLNISGE